jgi:hypothetical protein
LQVGKGTAKVPLKIAPDTGRQLIRRMVHSSTEEEYRIAWNTARREWSTADAGWADFLEYFTDQWHNQVEEWTGYSRAVRRKGRLEQYHAQTIDSYISLVESFASILDWQYEHGGIDTNNYLESWHQKLKKNYIKKRNMQLPDVIAMLLREVRTEALTPCPLSS